MGARTVTLIFSGSYFLLYRCELGLRQRMLLKTAGVKGGGMFLCPGLCRAPFSAGLQVPVSLLPRLGQRHDIPA